MAIFFYFFAFLLVLGSVMVITSRNPVYAVLWLIFAFCNASGIMVLMGAEFLAMMIIIIYVGAVDMELTAKSYIVPGLGDAGDLAFGIK